MIESESLLPGPPISALKMLTGTQHRFQKAMPGLLFSTSFSRWISVSLYLSLSVYPLVSPFLSVLVSFPLSLSPLHLPFPSLISLFSSFHSPSLSFSHSLVFFLFPYFLSFDEFQTLEAEGANNQFLKRKLRKKSLQHFREPVKVYWKITLSELMYSPWEINM